MGVFFGHFFASIRRDVYKSFGERGFCGVAGETLNRIEGRLYEASEVEIE